MDARATTISDPTLARWGKRAAECETCGNIFAVDVNVKRLKKCESCANAVDGRG